MNLRPQIISFFVYHLIQNIFAAIKRWEGLISINFDQVVLLNATHKLCPYAHALSLCILL